MALFSIVPMNNGEEMDPSSILFVIQPVTIDTMLNNNGPLLNNRLTNVACKHDLTT